jgi:transcriptional regulator with XRE-family HTH domain
VCATNLRRLRHPEGRSQDEFGYEAEIRRSYFAQLRNSAYYASRKIVGRLAEALGSEPAELLHRRRFRDATMVSTQSTTFSRFALSSRAGSYASFRDN